MSSSLTCLPEKARLTGSYDERLIALCSIAPSSIEHESSATPSSLVERAVPQRLYKFSCVDRRQPVCALLWLSLWRPLLRASARIRAVLPRPLAVNCWLRALLGQLSSAPRADAISPLPRIDIVHLRAFGASDRPMLARWMASPAIGIARQTHSLHLISQRQASPSRRDSLLRVPHTYRQRCRSAPVVS